MALQNRVNPLGELVAVAERGTMMGNRGIIHDPKTKTLLSRRWQHQAWICCVLSFKNYQHPIMGPSAYTELFFLDEATAFAAGHRPCAYCRRSDFNAFKQAWMDARRLAAVSAPEIDRCLHRERVTRRREQIHHRRALDDVPDGTMVVHERCAALVWGTRLYPWSWQGYLPPVTRPAGIECTVLTPASTVDAFKAGYVTGVHESGPPVIGHARADMNGGMQT